MVSSDFTLLVFCSDVACKSTKPCHIADDDQSSVDTAELARHLNATLEKRSNPASDNAVSTSAAPRNEHGSRKISSVSLCACTQCSSTRVVSFDMELNIMHCYLFFFGD